MRRAVWLLLASVVSVGVLVLFVLPTRTLLDQRGEIAHIHAQIAALRTEDTTLQARASALRQPATIERVARQDFGLVLPGQKAYAVITTPTPAGAHHRAPAARRGHRHPWWALWRDL
ncbi:MAG: septum formation initiator family protein [Acidimicrobiales bacterium]